MTTSTYNGHKNYETWNVSLWLNNDECLNALAQQSGDYVNLLTTLQDCGITETLDGVDYEHADLDYEALNELVQSIH